MRAKGMSGRGICALAVPALGAVLALSGCKGFTERYIALEVWKYEKCFGHLPPGFVPPGAAAPAGAMAGPAPRICGQQAACPQANPCPPADSCDPCQGGAYGHPGGMGGPAPMPGTFSGGGAPGPTPAGFSAGRPIIISDEVVSP